MPAITLANHKKIEHFVLYSLLVFISGFYLLIPGKLHNNLFYAFVAAPSLYLIWRSRKQLTLNHTATALLVLLLYSAVSSSWSIPERRDTATSLKYALYIAVFFFSVSLAINHNQFRGTFLKAIYISATLSAITNSFIWYSEHSISSRMYGALGIHECIGLGVSYGFASVLAFNDAISSYKRKDFIISSACFTALLIAVILTQSKLALICTMCSIAILCFFIRNKKILAAIIFIIITLTIIFIINPDFYRRHFKLLEQVFITGNFPRLLIWENLITNMGNNWLLGHGLNTPLKNHVEELARTYATAHNVYVGQFFLTGIIGLALLLNFVLQSLRNSIEQARTKNDFLPLSLIVFSTLCMGGQYTYLIDHPNEIWINVLIPIAISISHNKIKP